MAQVAPDGSFLKVNQALCQMLGYSEEELFQRTFQDLTHPDDLEADLAFVRQMLSGAIHTYQMEKRYFHKNGNVIWASLSVSLVRDQEGQPLYFISQIQDISERRQVESDRIARQAAEEANRAKSAFLSNMSHEIRTPLNAILGFAQILERDASLSPRQKGILRTIRRSGQHLLNLINDILDMSKIEAGRLELNPIDFCLHDLLDDVEMMFRSRAQAKGLQLLMERADDLPRYVDGDEAKLRQVLINLVGNAIKFTETGGVVVRVRVDAEPEGIDGKAITLRLVVEVEDSGPGIPADELDRIFEPFRQSAAGRDAGGTGLGLAVSRRLVELMGGRLTVKSQIGKGSCFRFDAMVKLAAGAPQEIGPEMRQMVGLEPGTGPSGSWW